MNLSEFIDELIQIRESYPKGATPHIEGEVFIMSQSHDPSSIDLNGFAVCARGFEFLDKGNGKGHK